MAVHVNEWNARIDEFLREENAAAGRQVPVRRIYCQDRSDRSGGGLYNETVTIDTIGRFARALGDSNPLYSDPEYAEKSVRRGIVAPPLLECCICSVFIGGKVPRLRGVQVFDAGTRWERFAEIRPGDSFSAVTTFAGVEERTKPGSGGRLLVRSHRIDLMNHRGEHVSRLTARSIIKCPAPAAETLCSTGEQGSLPDVSARGQGSLPNASAPGQGSLPDVSAPGQDSLKDARSGGQRSPQDAPRSTAEQGRPHYTQAQLKEVYANLDAQLSGDFCRGGAVRYWEDVEIGERLPVQITGPYDESDGQALMAAIGAANAFATKWGTIRRQKGPGLIDPETGARRHPIDRHISDAVARTQGLPRAIASGIHSQALLAKSAGDWMSDAGSLRSLDCRCRRPLYFGDLSFQRGHVVRKAAEGNDCFVVLHMEAVNQEGIVHTEAEAVVQLPRRSAAGNAKQTV